MDEQPPKKHPMLEQTMTAFGIAQESMPAAPSDGAFHWPMPKKPFSVTPGKGKSKGHKASPRVRGRSGRGRGRRTQDWGY